MRKLLTGILLGCVAGITCVVLSDVFMNPGGGYFMTAFEKSEQWAARLRSESDAPCYIMEGSSDVRMSIDPAAMEDENGLRAVNAGAHAGNGENVNVIAALRMSRPGDTLVSFPVSYWKPSDDNVPGGIKFLFHRHGFRAFEPGLADFNLRQLLYVVRGNTFYFFMHLGKLAMGVPTTYRYDRIGVTRESGWTEIARCYFTPQSWMCGALGDDRLQVRHGALRMPFLKSKCAEYGLSLVVQLPRGYRHESYRAQGAFDALYLVRQGIKVLKDPALGVETDAQMLGDTSLHHNSRGAQAYSRMLARLLAKGEYWTEAALVEELHSRGWNEDGTRMKTPPGNKKWERPSPCPDSALQREGCKGKIGA